MYLCFVGGANFAAVGTGDTTGLTVEEVEETEQVEDVEPLLSERRDGERVSSTDSSMGLGSGAGDNVVAESSDGLLGGVFEPGDGMNGGASTFKGLLGERLQDKGVVVGRGRDLTSI